MQDATLQGQPARGTSPQPLSRGRPPLHHLVSLRRPVSLATWLGS